jgi:hypothetical protein
MNKNRKCICCGTAYTYCDSCPSDRYKESWYAIYCSENCRKIFKAANDFFFEKSTKEEAAEIILSCDLSNLENFKPGVREDIEDILKIAEPDEPVVVEPVVTPKKKKKAVEPILETIEVVLNDEV